MKQKIELSLSNEEALVFFEWISSLEESASAPDANSAERAVLWKIEGRLESTLQDVFASDYEDRLAKARSIVTGKIISLSLVALV